MGISFITLRRKEIYEVEEANNGINQF